MQVSSCPWTSSCRMFVNFQDATRTDCHTTPIAGVVCLLPALLFVCHGHSCFFHRRNSLCLKTNYRESNCWRTISLVMNKGDRRRSGTVVVFNHRPCRLDIGVVSFMTLFSTPSDLKVFWVLDGVLSHDGSAPPGVERTTCVDSTRE